MRLTLRQIERVVWLLENSIRIPFTRWRIGLDPILGLVPWLGDLVAAAISTLLLIAAVQYRVPFVILGRLTLNIVADFLIGLIPVAGDLGDLFFRSNRRNLELLRNHMHGARPPRLADYLMVWGLILVLFVLFSLLLYGVFLLGAWLFPRPTAR